MDIRNRPGKRERDNSNGGGHHSPDKSGNPRDSRDEKRRR